MWGIRWPGYHGACVKKDHFQQGGGCWGAPLPAVQQIMRKHREYDLWSMQATRAGTLPGAQGPESWPWPAAEMRDVQLTSTPDDHGAFWTLWHPRGF